MNQNQNQNSRKRKADSLGRLEQVGSSTKGGRGALVGWTLCPLCGRHSQKKFALGRGIAAHLHAVHTPWKPGKAERRKRRRLREEAERLRKKIGNQQGQVDTTDSGSSDITHLKDSWEPTDEEVQQWEERVLKIVQEIEHAHQQQHESEQQSTNNGDDKDSDEPKTVLLTDRLGNKVQSYRNSLPPFIAAAADGNLVLLERMVVHAKKQEGQEQQVGDRIQTLLNSRDRHLSTAEHWAAGEGHLSCLKYLLELRQICSTKAPSVIDPKNSSATTTTRKIRRRDGKTCLHYAARNGRNDCVSYLIDQCGFSVDEASGDATTPFHLACFGLHLSTLQLLHEKGANPQQTNDWGCSAAHWVGMAKTKQEPTVPCTSSSGKTITKLHDDLDSRVKDVCNFLRTTCGVDFVRHQKHGHSALHKAAQNRNYAVIRWMANSQSNGGAGLSKQEREQAGACDVGGHKPSEILNSVEGDPEFVGWMKEIFGW